MKKRELIVTQYLNDMGVQIKVETKPLIRCKECKFNNGESKCFAPNSVFQYPSDDDYCSYGERKAEDENEKS